MSESKLKNSTELTIIITTAVVTTFANYFGAHYRTFSRHLIIKHQIYVACSLVTELDFKFLQVQDCINLMYILWKHQASSSPTYNFS